MFPGENGNLDLHYVIVIKFFRDVTLYQATGVILFAIVENVELSGFGVKVINLSDTLGAGNVFVFLERGFL